MIKVEAVRAVPVKPPVTEVVIRLNEAEARMLLKLTGNISGSTGPEYAGMPLSIDPCVLSKYPYIRSELMDRLYYLLAAALA